MKLRIQNVLKFKEIINESRSEKLKTLCKKLTNDIIKNIPRNSSFVESPEQERALRKHRDFEAQLRNELEQLKNKLWTSGIPFEEIKSGISQFVSEMNKKINFSYEKYCKLWEKEFIKDGLEFSISDHNSWFGIIKYINDIVIKINTIKDDSFDRLDVGGKFIEKEGDIKISRADISSGGTYEIDAKKSMFAPPPERYNPSKTLELTIVNMPENYKLLMSNNEYRTKLYVLIYRTLYHELYHSLQAYKVDPRKERITFPKDEREREAIINHHLGGLDDAEKILGFIRFSFLDSKEIESYARDLLIEFKKTKGNTNVGNKELITKFYYDQVMKFANYFLNEIYKLYPSKILKKSKLKQKEIKKYTSSVFGYFSLFIKKINKYYIEKMQKRLDIDKILEMLKKEELVALEENDLDVVTTPD